MVVDHLGGDHYSLHSNRANQCLCLQDMTTSLASNAISPGGTGGPADRPQDVEMQNECSFLGGKIGQSHGKICLWNLQGIFVCCLSLARKSGEFHGHHQEVEKCCLSIDDFYLILLARNQISGGCSFLTLMFTPVKRQNNVPVTCLPAE